MENKHQAAVDDFEHTVRDIMANETHKCPKCGELLKVKTKCHVTIEQPSTNARQKKDPNEPVSIDEFIKSMRASKQKHIQIIGEYADTLREIRPKWTPYTVRGEWTAFTDRNLRAAIKLVPTWNTEEGRAKIGRVIDKIKGNGFLTDEFTLETILNQSEKV